jgi:branched-chain amino acid transport system substrate-binding protein
MKSTDGGYFINHYSPEDSRPEVQDWIKKYRAKHNADPDALGTLAYDGARLLIVAAAQAGSKESDKVKDALNNLKGFKGVTGEITFDANGDPVKSAFVI